MKIFTDNCHVQLTAAYELATAIAEAVKRNLHNMKIRYDYSDGDIGRYRLEGRLQDSRWTLSHCVLSENGFMTKEKECCWLQTEYALEVLTMAYVEGLTDFMNS